MEDNLEQMRAQMSLLKDRLSRCEIITDKTVCDTIKGHIAIFNRTRRQNIIMMALSMVFTPLCLKSVGMPLWVIIFTMVFFLTALVYEMMSYGRIDDSSMSRDDLVAISCTAAKMIKRNARWLIFSIPTVIVWLALFVIEIIAVHGPAETGSYILAGATTGAVIGAILGTKRYLGARRNARSIIDEIAALKG